MQDVQGRVLRPVVLGQVADDVGPPVAIEASSPNMRLTVIFITGYNPDGTQASVKVYDNGPTGNVPRVPVGVPVEITTINIRNGGDAAGTPFTRVNDLDTGEDLGFLEATFELIPGSTVSFCFADAPGCQGVSIGLMPDRTLTINIVAGHTTVAGTPVGGEGPEAAPPAPPDEEEAPPPTEEEAPVREEPVVPGVPPGGEGPVPI